MGRNGVSGSDGNGSGNQSLGDGGGGGRGGDRQARAGSGHYGRGPSRGNASRLGGGGAALRKNGADGSRSSVGTVETSQGGCRGGGGGGLGDNLSIQWLET